MDLLKLMMALSGGFAEGNASDELKKLDDLLTEAGIIARIKARYESCK